MLLIGLCGFTNDFLCPKLVSFICSSWKFGLYGIVWSLYHHKQAQEGAESESGSRTRDGHDRRKKKKDMKSKTLDGEER